MQRMTEQLQKLSAVMVVLIAVLTGLNYCVSRVRLAQMANAPAKLTVTQVATVLAKRDKADSVDAYVNGLNRLLARCTENHEVLGGMASTLVKKWNKPESDPDVDTAITHLQGMEILIDELGDKPKSACTDDFLNYLEGLR